MALTRKRVGTSKKAETWCHEFAKSKECVEVRLS